MKVGAKNADNKKGPINLLIDPTSTYEKHALGGLYKSRKIY